ALPRPTAPHGPAAHGPPHAREARRLRRASGGVPRTGRLPERLPPQPDDAVLPLAAHAHRAEVARATSAAPRRAGARRLARGLAVPRAVPAGQLGLTGGPPAGPPHLAQSGGRQGRAADPRAGGPQRDGPARPRGARAAPLRADEQRRD